MKIFKPFLETIFDFKKCCKNTRTGSFSLHQASPKVHALCAVSSDTIFLTEDLIQISLTFPLMSFFYPKIQSRTPPCLPLWSSSASTSSCPYLSGFWHFWRVVGQWFYRMFLNLGSSNIFWLNTTDGVGSVSGHHIREFMRLTCLIICNTDFDQLVKVVSAECL